MEKHETDCYIVTKDRHYYQTSSRHLGGSVKIVKFSENLYDAKRYRKKSDALRKAKETKGIVLKFDPLNGTTSECDSEENE